MKSIRRNQNPPAPRCRDPVPASILEDGVRFVQEERRSWRGRLDRNRRRGSHRATEPVGTGPIRDKQEVRTESFSGHGGALREGRDPDPSPRSRTRGGVLHRNCRPLRVTPEPEESSSGSVRDKKNNAGGSSRTTVTGFVTQSTAEPEPVFLFPRNEMKFYFLY